MHAELICWHNDDIAPCVANTSWLSLLLPILLRCVAAWSVGSDACNLPNIVFILADDLGFNNVGWQQKKHGMEPEIHTPVIDELAENGLHLDRMYSYKYCSPSRSSFLSGRLPIHVTQNNKNNLVTNPGGADLRMKLLPQALKERFNYKTHMVGKWHVGARSEANLPVERGFDSHFGFLKGGEDHLTQESSDANLQFVDLWRDRKPAYHENGTFSTIMYTEEAVDIITKHGQHSIKDPLFMFLAYQATHTPWKCQPVGT